MTLVKFAFSLVPYLRLLDSVHSWEGWVFSNKMAGIKLRLATVLEVEIP